MRSNVEERVPILMVDENWPVDDIKTLEDADEAVAVLVDSIASIKFQLEAPPRNGARTNDEYRLWEARARLALRLKEAALEEVKERRARLSKKAFRDYVITRIVKKHVDTTTFEAWRDEAEAAFPELFD